MNLNLVLIVKMEICILTLTLKNISIEHIFLLIDLNEYKYSIKILIDIKLSL